MAATVAAIEVLLGACSTMSQGQPSPKPEWPRIVHIAIEAVPLDNGAGLGGREDFRDVLTAEATTAAERLILLGAFGGGGASLPAQTALSGTLWLPTELPPNVSAHSAAFQPGALARAKLELTSGDGRVVAMATAEIEWDEVLWTRGGPKIRRARPTDLVLMDAVDHVLRRAVHQLARNLRDGAASTRTGAPRASARVIALWYLPRGGAPEPRWGRKLDCRFTAMPAIH